MNDWKYQMKGVLLREAMKTDTPFILLGSLVTTVKRFNAHMDEVNAFPEDMRKEFFDFYHKILNDFTDGEDELYNSVIVDDFVSDDLKSFVDFRMSELYELCERWKVWLLL